MDFIVGWFFPFKMVDNFYTACVFPCLTCLVNLTQQRKKDIDSSRGAVHHLLRAIMWCELSRGGGIT